MEDDKLGSKHPYFDRRRRSIVQNFFRLTSIHGLPAIARAYNKRNLVCWSIIFFCFFVVMLYFVVTSILTYFTYPTQTNVDIVVEYPMLFPAITVCNYAGIRYDLIIEPFTNYLMSIGLLPANNTAPVDINNLKYIYLLDEFLVGLLNKNASVGDYMFQLNEILFSCTYNGLTCNATNFVLFTSSKYGLCYTFNAMTSSTGDTASIRKTTDNGGQGVLAMDFYIYDYLNIPYLNDGVGMIVMLHDNTQVPQVDVNGIGLAPNRLHTLQFSKEKTSFLSAPYTNCTAIIRSDMKAMFETSYAGTQYQYSKQICLGLCAQTYVYSVCNCTSPLYWNVRTILLSNGTVIFARICAITNQCYSSATNKFLNDLGIIERQCAHCTSECQLTSFNMQLSSILAPTIFTQMSMKQWVENNSLINSSRTIKPPADWAGNSTAYINQNYVGLQVVLGSFLVNSYTQLPTLSWTDVISNVGGQTGLWIGVSMLSVIELLEMCYWLIRPRCPIWREK